ncbi:MAG: tetratricopeptide repeat protein [Thiobacillaceae bacterium]
MFVGINVAHVQTKIMKPSLSRFVGSLSIVLCLATPPVAAGQYDDGKVAFNREDFATALRLLRPLADRGNAEAQTLVGSMYALGEGVPQDYAAAIKWYGEAAARGDAGAQFGLGGIYFFGNGVPQDFVQAHKWFSLAALRSSGDVGFLRYFSRRYRDRVADRMTREQIAEAQKLAREWKPKEN